MSRPKPPPPPRIDLDEQGPVEDVQGHSQTTVSPSSNTSSAPSKRLPPPIPLRPDLGEGVNDDIQVPSAPVPKIPPPVIEKKASHIRSKGRPEITIISAQPMASHGIVSPPALVSSHPTGTPDVISPTESPCVANSAHTPPAITPGLVTTTPLQAGHSPPTAASGIINPISPPPIVSSPSTTAPGIGRPRPQAAQMYSQPMTTPINKPSPPAPSTYLQSTSPFSNVEAVTPPSATNSQPIISPSRPAPTIPSKPTSPFSPASSNTSSPSPNRIHRTPKNREPPQRPKSKPVCELPVSGEESIGGVGVINTSSIDDQGESPIAPKRKKNKSDKNKTSLTNDFDSSFGINNSAFFENEPNQEEDINMVNRGASQNATSTKAKPAPSVIRTKPNGKDKPSPSVTQESFQQVDNSDNVLQIKSAKPTVIKPPPKLKPPPSAKKPSVKQDKNSDIIPQVTPPSQSEVQEAALAKPKSKPTLIIPKAKKESGNKNESYTEIKTEDGKIVSPTDKPETTQKDNVQDKKSSKTKRTPNIIRPNKLKKDASSPQGDVVGGFRGTPEGESQESSKKGPVRKAPPPPRPGPPKPAPPRPGPPRRAAPEEPKTSIEPAHLTVKFETHPRIEETSGIKTVEVEESHVPEAKKKAKQPRPATIGKEEETEDHKSTDIAKKKKHKKKPAEPVVQSVVSTKIEPSAIALYDYVPTSIDDLSFKAGDEIFLVKRVNEEWYIGRCGDCEGMMPVKFVEIIEDLPPEPEEPSAHKASPKTSGILSTVALYDFQAQSSDELTLNAGDTVHLLELINDEWLKGQNSRNIGIFPTNFVDIDEDMKQKLKQKQSSKPATLNNASQGNLTKKASIVSFGPRCKAVYDYDSGNPDDLRFSTGDIIKITERVNPEWLKGEIHGATGMFPTTFVEIIEDLKETSSKHDSSTFPVTTALHDFISHTEGDLQFKKGERITIIRKINDDWLEGELNSQRGMLPCAFVEHVELPGLTHHQTGDKTKPQDHLLPKGKALYDFTAENDSELTFKAGDEIILLKYINEEWMEGEMNDNIGQFPVAFIEILVPLP